jgi:hypothetical protein
MVLLYYRIFKAIRERARKTIGSGKSSSIATTAASGAGATPRRKTDDTSLQDVSHALVIENVAQTQHQEHLLDKIRHPLPLIMEAGIVDSRDVGEEEDDDDEEEDDDDSEAETMECKVIRNPAVVTPLHGNHSNTRSQVSQSTRERNDGRSKGQRSSLEYPVKRERGNGNPDSGYVPSSHNLEETQFTLSISTSIPLSKPTVNSIVRENKKRFSERDDFPDLAEDDNNLTAGNGSYRQDKKTSQPVSKMKHESSSELHRPSSSSDKTVKSKGDYSSGSKDDEEESPSFEGDDRVPPSTSTSPAPQATASVSSVSATMTEDKKKKKLRFHLRRKPKETTIKKQREKASAKRERKATKTLAIVLGKKKRGDNNNKRLLSIFRSPEYILSCRSYTFPSIPSAPQNSGRLPNPEKGCLSFVSTQVVLSFSPKNDQRCLYFAYIH